MSLEGHNPAVLKGHPFGFNIKLSGNVDKLVVALVKAVRAAERLEDFVGQGKVVGEGSALAAMAGEPVLPRDFDLDRVPAHLLVRFRVEDATGGEVATGRDLAALRAGLSGRARRQLVARRIGYVFQSPADNLLVDMSVVEHVRMAWRMRAREPRGAVDELLGLQRTPPRPAPTR